MSVGGKTLLAASGAAMRKIVLMLLLACANTVATAEWIKIGGSEIMTVYADPATIRRAGALAQMWDLFDFKAVQTIDGWSFLSAKNWVEYDCKEARWRNLQISHYAGNKGSGKRVYNNSKPGDWEAVPMDSAIGTKWKLVCAKR
jgi:hypothetical protein